jgi:hypothetical protein
MKSTDELSARESLDLIASMIMEAKGNVQRNNFYFLLWGCVVVICDVGMYTLAMLNYAYPYIVWLLTVPAWIFTIARSFSKTQDRRTKTHFDTISGWLWISYGITIFVFVAFGHKINYQLIAVITLLSAIPTLVSGVILKFKPLIAGGIAFWIGGVICFLSPADIQPLVGAFTIVGGYLIPGYMLRKSESE